MILGSLVKISFDALWVNKLRSGLTLLGILIGVTSVMTIVSALEGMSDAIKRDLESMGPSTFMVMKMGIVTSDEMWWDKVKRKPINMKSVELVEAGCTLCEKIAPRAFQGANVKYRNETLHDVFVIGSTSNYVDIVDLEVAQGRFHASEDDLYRRNVVFVGDQIRETFFEGLDPLGKEIRLDDQKYTVIGVAKKQGSTFGDNQDNFVVIPLNSFFKQFGEPRRRGINMVVKAVSVERMGEAQDQVRAILRAQRHVPFNAEDDFDMLTADNILEVLNSITKVLRWGLIGISSISLVVGGIVVMNIMMVSVTERTREIGIRKAIGARQKHILAQFLFESLILTMSGGLAGIVFGYLIAKSLVGMIDMEIQPSTLAIMAGLTISTGTGLIFGIYPAMKAARLDPVKAMSYE